MIETELKSIGATLSTTRLLLLILLGASIGISPDHFWTALIYK